jgi:site-specific DNA recombinase
MKDIISQSKKTTVKPEKGLLTMLRYAAYLRISSEEQVGNYSIDAQHHAIQAWVQAQEGHLVKVYIDEAQSGRTADRPAFQQMRQDARKRMFDALVVHKFDRFARNRTDALAIKSLLRYDYGIKVFSVTEPGEDSDGPIGALIEGIMESVAEWYSRNLATEIAKGRREKGSQGFHSNRPPFGYKKDGKLIVPDEREAEGVRLAFEAYATGRYAIPDIAHLLNENGYRITSGRQFGKDAVAHILRNEVYIGKIRYHETRYKADGSRSFGHSPEIFDGQHEPIIDEALFAQCQQVRKDRSNYRRTNTPAASFLLRGLIYCYRCSTNIDENNNFSSRGKIYCRARAKPNANYYRCSSRVLGFPCEQLSVRTQVIDEQVVALLLHLKPPDNWRHNIIRTMGAILGERSLEARLQEIQQTLERMDFRWDNGFITDKYDYLEKRLKLQQELEQLTPVQNELEVAADLLENFATHWELCKGDIAQQHELLRLIIERVYIKDDSVVAITLKSDYHIILGHNGDEPTYMDFDPLVQQRVQDLSLLYQAVCRRDSRQ